MKLKSVVKPKLLRVFRINIPMHASCSQAEIEFSHRSDLYLSLSAMEMNARSDRIDINITPFGIC